MWGRRAICPGNLMEIVQSETYSLLITNTYINDSDETYRMLHEIENADSNIGIGPYIGPVICNL